MSQLHFFTPVSYQITPNSLPQQILEKADAYFYLKGKRALVISKDVEKNIQNVELVDSSPSVSSIALKVASYFTLFIPLIMLSAKIILRNIYQFQLAEQKNKINENLSNCEEDKCHVIITDFWKTHIASFKLGHGTTSLYRSHFEKYGISPTYPEALSDIILRIRKVWTNHVSDIEPKTSYFKMFEERYDEALKEQQVQVSFTGDRFRQQEYTTGARGYGGEWIRELKHFFHKIKSNNKEQLLSSEEKETVLEMQSLIEVMREVSPIVVKVPYYLINNYGGDKGEFCFLQIFENKIKTECPNWNNSELLLEYLNSNVLPQLNRIKERIENHYEITAFQSISPEHLEFELIDSSFNNLNYPHLEFDRPTELSSSETGKLLIRSDTLCSEREEYLDSTFEIQSTDKRSYVITRRKIELSEKDSKKLKLTKKRIELSKEWMRKFNVSFPKNTHMNG